MTFRVFWLVFVLGVAIEEFVESAGESDKDCSISLLQNNMQRSGVRGTMQKEMDTEGMAMAQTEQDSLDSQHLAETSVKAESGLLKSAFLKDVAQAILNKQGTNRTLARETARRRALGY
eukprot:Skav212940  [mRNA]  locus=scaffold374:477961:480863:- [translate_table: standard]